MKKLIMLILALSTGYIASAQHKGKTQYMTILLNENNYKMNMIITRTDSAQVQKHVDLTLKHVKARDYDAAHENLVLQLLKVYLDQGWKLVSTATSSVTITGASAPPMEKFYLSRNQ